MKYLNLFCFLILSFTIHSQERISSIVNTQISTQYIRTYNDKQYLIKVSNKDEVTVYDFKGPEEFKKLHSANLSGVSKANLYFFGNIFIYGNSLFQEIYNFVEGTQSGLPTFSSAPMFQNWVLKKKNSGVYNASSFSGGSSNSILFDPTLTLSTKKLPVGFSYLDLHDIYLYTLRSYNSKGNEYYMYNSVTEKFEILVEDSDQKHEVSFDGDKAYYLDIDQAVVEYNLPKADRKEYGIYSMHKGIKNAVLKSDDKIIVYNYKADSNYIEIFNALTKQKINDFTYYSKGELKSNLWLKLEDKIIYQNIRNKIVIVDLENSSQIKEYDINSSFTFVDWPIYNNRYLALGYKKEIKIIDLLNLNEVKTNLGYSSEGILDVNFFDTSDGAFGLNVQFTDRTKANTFKVNNDLTLTPYDEFGNENLGIDAGSIVNAVDNDLYGIDTNFYYIKDASVTQVNTLKPKVDYLYNSKTINGKLYYYSVDGDSIFIVSIGKNDETVVARIGQKGLKNLSDLYETSKGLYLYLNQNTLLFYDFTTKNSKVISQQINSFNLGKLGSYKEDIYFISFDLVKRLSQDGTTKVLPIEMSNGGQSMNFREGYYLNNYNKIYKCNENGDFDLLYTSSTDFLSLEKTSSRLFFNDFSYVDFRYHLYAIKDDGAVEEHQPEGITENIYVKSDNAFYCTMRQLNNTKYFIFDHQKGLFVDLSQSLSYKNWLTVTVFDQDTIGVIMEGNKLVTYAITDNFSKIKELDRTSITISPYPTIRQFEKFIVCFIGDDMAIVNDQGKIKILSEDRASILNPSVEYNNGYIYYVGIDNVLGRQYYRYKIEESNAVTNAIPSTKRYTLYPNPAASKIHLQGLSTESVINYVITNESGTSTLQSCLEGNEIDVSALSAGIYYLRLEIAHERNYILPFIKL